uniref:Uncharacterized protein n=1 Tax=Physcomitrium patens TaxID=3218 RepID=A0A2K1JU58_PHYPA|nr:hypothetical protein PHYPA_014836 [Physcomitrium patens]
MGLGDHQSPRTLCDNRFIGQQHPKETHSGHYWKKKLPDFLPQMLPALDDNPIFSLMSCLRSCT